MVLSLSFPRSCAKAIVKTPRAASLARLSERMWREGAYTKLSALRKMKKKDSTASSPSSSSSSSPQRLQAFLKAVRDDYRALSRELRLRLPSSALQRDAPRVDVGRMQVREMEGGRERWGREGKRGRDGETARRERGRETERQRETSHTHPQENGIASRLPFICVDLSSLSLSSLSPPRIAVGQRRGPSRNGGRGYGAARGAGAAHVLSPHPAGAGRCGEVHRGGARAGGGRGQASAQACYLLL